MPLATRPPLVLGSLALDGLPAIARFSRALLVPTAANGLADRDAIVDATRGPLLDLGVELVEVDLDAGPVDPVLLGSVDAVVCSGGDPYRLLDAVRRSGFDRALASARRRGVGYLGISAGAVVAGPSLDPLQGVSPFARPPGLATTGLHLTGVVALPHDDRPGRRQLHAAAQRAWGAEHRLLGLRDDELLIPGDGGAWRVVDQRTGRSVRPASAGDEAGIAAVYVEAGRRAWGFVPTERYAGFEPPVAAWRDRLAALPHGDDLLVAEHDGRLDGFVWVRSAIDPDVGSGVGEVGAFYVRPSRWGSGTGRRLLDLGLDRLRAAGCDHAVLYTEERNARPRRIYERGGWVLDGAYRERRFLDVPIREVRYRLAL